ncbi:MAG: radical SAM family heme chaperone HemW [Bdellovibrionaceae bacterium]|nr:radical SAM family heme chaperone HemW [Pseudobdellovibrionaceae bacterium]
MSGSSILSPNSIGNQTVENFGVYIHIPYCLQRCTYCDFATYVHTEIIASEKYVELVKKEMALGQNLFIPRKLDTLYFGGGTPSLIPAEQITDLIQEIKKYDFTITPDTEITIEINPATVDERKLNHYLEHGVNRFSVGAQSFSDRLLKMVHREHNSKQTLETLNLLESYKLNYSFDVLFALPTQTMAELEYDLEVAMCMGMSHLSPYCLTVPEGHPLSKNRPLDVEQIEMFELIHKKLLSKNFHRYEISNYAQSGKESRHNLLYWTDQPYWGLGLSAHSYSKKSDWGTRFWNASNINVYEKNILTATESPHAQFTETNSETLERHQSLTDFCYTSLRLEKGLSKLGLVAKFGPKAPDKIEHLAKPLIDQGLMKFTQNSWSLTDKGIFISNQIFETFTFLKSDF